MNESTARFEEDLRRDLRQLADRAGQAPTPEQVLHRLHARPLPAGAPVPTTRLPRLAAAVIIAGLVGVALLWLALDKGPAIAWADVRDEILSAQTASWNVRIEIEGQDPVTWRVLSKEPGLIRQEMPGGLVVIADISKGVAIGLVSESKTALVMDMKDFLPEAVAGKGQNLSLAWFKELVAGGHEQLGEKDIGGIRVTGFRLKQRGITTGVMDIWVDPVTGYIVRSDFEDAEHALRMTTTDFELNPPLDYALFSTDVPEGYEIQTSQLDLDFGSAGEEDLLAGLRYLAEHNGNVFPKTLIDPFDMPSFRQAREELAAMDRRVAEINRGIADLRAGIKKREAEWEKAKEEMREILKQADITGIERRVGQVKKDVTKAEKADKPEPPPPPPASRPATERAPLFDDTLHQTEMRLIMAIAAIRMKSDEFEYFGGGVKLGDAATPIMWWRIKDAPEYRVVYGDLTIRNVKPSDLPVALPASDQ